MKHRKKLFVIIALVATTVSLGTVFAVATEIRYPEIASGIIAPATTRTLLPNYAKYIFSTLVALSGIIAFGSGAYAGVRIAISAGDPSAYGDAKDRLFSAGLGVAFTLGAVIILNTVDPRIITISPYNEMDLGVYLDSGISPDTGAPLGDACGNVKDLTALLSNSTIDPSEYYMTITKSNPDLGITFNAKCLKFISQEPATIEVKIYSQTNYAGSVLTYNNDTDPNFEIKPLPFVPRSISFVWKIAGVYLLNDANEEKYVPESTGVLGDFNDAATKIRFRSTIPVTDPDSIHFGAVLHEGENWSKGCKVYVTDGSIDGDTNWVTMVPESVPLLLSGHALSTSSVTTFNPAFQPTMSSDGVTFYEDQNFGGAKIGGPYRTIKNNLAGNLQDKTSSIKIEGNYIAILFEHENAEGHCEVFTKSDANLRDNPIGRCSCGPFGWGCKDCLSSFIIIPMR